MNCSEFREAHPASSDAAKAHLASCADCRAFAGSWELLREYPALTPSAGFYRALRRKLAPAILRFAAPIAAAAAVLLLAILFTHHPAPPGPAPEVITEEERELVENLELLQNYELARTLELVTENASTLLEEKK